MYKYPMNEVNQCKKPAVKILKHWRNYKDMKRWKYPSYFLISWINILKMDIVPKEFTDLMWTYQNFNNMLYKNRKT